MTDLFSVDDLYDVADCVADAWRGALDRDWSARAGVVDWSCAKAADHAVDTLLAPAFFLASRRTDAYPAGGWSPGEDAAPAAFADGVEMCARILGGVVSSTPDDVRALLIRHDGVIGRPADFAPRGGLELIIHARDVCTGLDVELDPPRDACEHLRRHVQHWPFWGGYWEPLTMDGDPWIDLLRASGRLAT
jgi:hypothetical protein